MSESITVQQADIHTAAVEVAIMRISGKQVTLSVFRQLKEEPVVDTDGHFVGLPWGTVNYHPPKECSGSSHVHVVWQKGSELRRAVLTQPTKSLAAWSEASADWVVAASAQGWRPSQLPRWDQDSVRVQFPSGVCEVDLPRALRDFWIAESAVYQHREPVHPDRPPASEEQLRAEVEADVRDFYERDRQRRLRWDEVRALPQLFIAV
jgi:hypothetical protein